MKRYKDLLWGTIAEGGLILVLATISWAARQPLIFASLEPTVYELVEQLQARSGNLFGAMCENAGGRATVSSSPASDRDVALSKKDIKGRSGSTGGLSISMVST
jgi:hypothetical protein